MPDIGSGSRRRHSFEFLPGDHAGLDQRRVERDRVMADRQIETVSAFPLRIFGAVW